MLRGSLEGKNLGDRVELRFMQRGNSDDNRNVPVKIYRRSAPEVPFSNDLSGMPYNVWYEYVDNQTYLDSRVKVIFEGTLPLEMSFNTYVDEDVTPGEKYIYWIEADSFGTHTVLGPLCVKVRSRDVWWPFDVWMAEMEKLRDEHSDIITIKQWGETTMHRPMCAMHIGNPDNVVAILGAVHASETGPELLLKAMRFILENNKEVFNRVGIALMPTVNIDVREETVDGVPHYLRLNHNGVDLNRNFDFNWREQFVYGMSNTFLGSVTYHGPYPNSENETQTVIRFLEAVNPITVFVFDSGSVITEDKIYYDGIPEGTPLFERSTELATCYSKAFRADHDNCGTFHAAPITFPYEEPVFKNTGVPNGTLDGWASMRFGVPAFNLQYAGSEEGKIRIHDNTTADLLNKWSIRHAHALMAVMNEL